MSSALQRGLFSRGHGDAVSGGRIGCPSVWPAARTPVTARLAGRAVQLWEGRRSFREKSLLVSLPSAETYLAAGSLRFKLAKLILPTMKNLFYK